MGTSKNAVTRITPEFTAAVRFCDGRRELYRIRKATDFADARQVVLDTLDGVRSLMISERPAAPWLKAA